MDTLISLILNKIKSYLNVFLQNKPKKRMINERKNKRRKTISTLSSLVCKVAIFGLYNPRYRKSELHKSLLHVLMPFNRPVCIVRN